MIIKHSNFQYSPPECLLTNHDDKISRKKIEWNLPRLHFEGVISKNTYQWEMANLRGFVGIMPLSPLEFFFRVFILLKSDLFISLILT